MEQVWYRWKGLKEVDRRGRQVDQEGLAVYRRNTLLLEEDGIYVQLGD